MDFINNILGKKPQAPLNPETDSGTHASGSYRIFEHILTLWTDFADFAAAPAPSPASIVSSPTDHLEAQPTGLTTGAVPYTKWYRVWERTQPSDFYTEAVLVPFLLLAVLVHVWGTRSNKRKAKKWMAVHTPILESEFALVGYSGQPKVVEGVQSEGLVEASAKLSGDNLPDDLLKTKTAWEFQSYASGRQNVAFADMKITVLKRYNPVVLAMEYAASLFFDSIKVPAEKAETIVYSFDGNEKNFVPSTSLVEKSKSGGSSSYDGFVFAIVNKMNMRRLRDERYDVSLTTTKDHPKLPVWCTVMSESAEVTDMMLTQNLISAVEQAGQEHFEYLIITDQPQDKPTTLDETVPKKRLHLSMKLGSYESTLPLFQVFLRLPDHLAQSAHFRPEVMRKINATRQGEIKKLQRVSEAEAEEERKAATEKLKKEERDRKLKGLSAEEQRKFLEKEKAKEQKKSEKRQVKRA